MYRSEYVFAYYSKVNNHERIVAVTVIVVVSVMFYINRISSINLYKHIKKYLKSSKLLAIIVFANYS